MKERCARACAYCHAAFSVTLDVVTHHDKRVRSGAMEDSTRFDEAGIECRVLSVNRQCRVHDPACEPGERRIHLCGRARSRCDLSPDGTPTRVQQSYNRPIGDLRSNIGCSPTREPRVPAKNIYHDTVIQALTADGWTITDDPLRVSYGGRDLFFDRIRR
jgi:hypothetical protein